MVEECTKTLDDPEISMPLVFGLSIGAVMLTWENSNPLHMSTLI